MAYIYKITNTKNGKIYIGKTQFSVQKRFAEHCSDAFKERNENRPLYAAMRKYGINNFSVETVEETSNAEEREKYWIEYYGSFKNGYNATTGGDGTSYLDYELLIKTYQITKSVAKTAKMCQCDEGHLSDILKDNNIIVLSNADSARLATGKMVGQFSLTNDLIKIFPSIKEAAKAVVPDKKSAYSHISEVCNGKRKTAYGYIWKFC
jgi:predicted GIY-YIG superfamily endonuclease